MSTLPARKGPVLFVVMDGWGLRKEEAFNAVRLAKTPNYDRLTQDYPATAIKTSGPDVGLPKNTMGNSEVGHLNIGAGRVVWQELMRINNAIADLSFFSNPALLGAIEHAKKNNSKLHLFGLISGAVVHSCEEHYAAIVRMARQHGLTGDRVVFHCFTDGRDTSPHSGATWMASLEKKLAHYDTGVIGSVIGRYYAMDRDKRWSRVHLAYDLMVNGKHEFTATSGAQAIAHAYARAKEQPKDGPFPPESDEFIRPTLIVDDEGKPLGTINDSDAVISFNHRSDRPREIIRALTENQFEENTKEDREPGFNQDDRPDIYLVTMTDYRAGFDAPIAFASDPLTGTLGEATAQAGLKQFHSAETEKYPHVTFFFNGGLEAPFDGETRYMANSPEVATYDMQPEMSAPELTKNVLEAIASESYDLLIVNYANGDMVGHTGSLESAIKAVETVDHSIGELSNAILEKNGDVLITADHGNCEQMWDEEANGPHTAHTTNLVPCFLVSERCKGQNLRDGGRLADLAPTLCQLLGIDPTSEMNGQSLLANT